MNTNETKTNLTKALEKLEQAIDGLVQAVADELNEVVSEAGIPQVSVLEEAMDVAKVRYMAGVPYISPSWKAIKKLQKEYGEEVAQAVWTMVEDLNRKLIEIRESVAGYQREVVLTAMRQVLL